MSSKPIAGSSPNGIVSSSFLLMRTFSAVSLEAERPEPQSLVRSLSSDILFSSRTDFDSR